MRTTLLVVILAAALGTAVQAQELPIGRGDHVKFRTSQAEDRVDEKFVGVVTNYFYDMLVVRLDDGPAVEISVASITSLEVMRRTGSRAVPYALAGLAVGAGTGAIIGIAAHEGCKNTTCGNFTSTTMAIGGSLLLGGVGTIAGYFAGKKKEVGRWEKVPLDPNDFTVVPNRRGIGVGFRFSF